MELAPAPVVPADSGLRGAEWCRLRSDLVDAWLVEVVQAALGGRTGDELALVAVGGYGRGELAPHSDLDLVLLHRGRKDVAEIAGRVWYPIWDAGLKLGHNVGTVKESLAIAENDLDTATTLLSGRHLVGDEALTRELVTKARDRWEHRSRRWLVELGARVRTRHDQTSEVAFTLEPDLKEGRGGLRDVHSLLWAEAANQLLATDRTRVDEAYDALLAARVELQQLTGRAGNTLALQDQDGVAERLGDADADALMARIAAAGRTIAWTSDDTWRRIQSSLRGPVGRGGGRDRPLEPGLALRDGEVHVTADADLSDPTLVLRAAAVAARQDTVLDRSSLERLAADAPALPDPWPAGVRDHLADLLLAGQPAVTAIEALDQRGIWTRILPEWSVVRSRPQRNAYHRFTVDRHLLETVANAAALADGVERPDLLVLGALLHDLGKGYPGDHTAVGVDLAHRLGRRMGLDDGEIALIATLVQHHLLLSEVALRRDLDDPATIESVADAVGDTTVLSMLAALTEADSKATGPAAWGPSKAQLVDVLVKRVAQVLDGLPFEDIEITAFPTAEQLEDLAAGGTKVTGKGNVLTVVTDDRPGLFSRIAGALTLHGLEIVSAAAYSSDDGRVIDEFQILDPYRVETRWDRVERDVHRALDGRLALRARIAERARTYASRYLPSPQALGAVVRFFDDASSRATVVEVQATDAVGLLYRITAALTELDVDIRSARVQTMGHRVVDVFYVLDHAGEKLTDPDLKTEVERAILHALD